MNGSTYQPHFTTANLRRRRTLIRRRQRHQHQCQILRSQLGFRRVSPSRPVACHGCLNYHGKVYGQTRMQRTPLICGIHPHGWQESGGCPDWYGKDDVRKASD